MSNNFTDNDFVYTTTKDGDIRSGGFTLKSTLIGNGLPIMQTGGSIDANGVGNNKVFNIFQDRAVPIGLFNQHGGKSKNNSDSCDKDVDINNTKYINDDIYNKLLKMAEVDGKISRVQTRKNRKRPRILEDNKEVYVDKTEDNKPPKNKLTKTKKNVKNLMI
jgi:hypothetical protein